MSVGGLFKAIGRIVATPVTVPAKAIRRGAEKTMQAAIMGILRHVLTYVGGVLTFTGDDLTQFVAAIMTLVGLVWSLIEKRERSLR